MVAPADEQLIKFPRDRDGRITEAHLADGRIIQILNIAWGYDDGNPYAHVTTNISPKRDDLSVDFFFTHELVALVVPETGQRIYEARSGEDA